MLSSRWVTWPALAALACLVAIGCGGNDYSSVRGPNRAPFIVEGSLKWRAAGSSVWEHGDSEVIRGISYTYSVAAIDPDIGDTIVRYEWRFGDEDIPRQTTAPAILYAFAAGTNGTVAVRATDSHGAVGPETVFEIPLSQDAPSLVITPVMPAQPMTINIDTNGHCYVPFEFEVALSASSSGSLGTVRIMEFDPTGKDWQADYSVLEADTTFTPTHYRCMVTYYGAGAVGTEYFQPVLQVGDTNGNTSNEARFATVTIQTVNTPNNSPQITIANPGPITASASQPASLSFTVYDADNDNVAWTVDWGDWASPSSGYATMTSSGAPVSLQHQYASIGSFTVTITASDGRRDDSDAEPKTIAILVQ